MKIVYEEGDYVGVLMHKSQLAMLNANAGPTCHSKSIESAMRRGYKGPITLSISEADKVFGSPCTLSARGDSDEADLHHLMYLVAGKAVGLL